MPLQLLPIEDSDLMIYEKICAEVFKNDLHASMFPNGISSETLDHLIQKNMRDLKRYPVRLKMMKVIDTDLPEDDEKGKIVGVAKWNIWQTDGEIDKASEEEDSNPSPPGANVAFLERLHETVDECRKAIMGNKAHVHLSILGTDPKHQRRGIGAVHMEWGIEEADRLGVPTYIESTMIAKPLYEKFGLREVMPLPLDTMRYGLDHDVPHVCMLRPATGSV